MDAWRKPTSVNAKNARKVYVAIEDVKATRAAAEPGRVQGCLGVNPARRKTRGVTTRPGKILLGSRAPFRRHRRRIALVSSAAAALP